MSKLKTKRKYVFPFFIVIGVFLISPQIFAIADPGYLLVSNFRGGGVSRFNGTTGDFIDNFIPKGSGGWVQGVGIVLGPDNNLYASSPKPGQGKGSILRFNGTTGEFIDIFVPNTPGAFTDLVFGPDDNLYATNVGGLNKVIRFNGTTGAFIDDFVPSGSGGLLSPYGLTFGPDENLYVASRGNNRILRYDGDTGEFIDVFAIITIPFDLAFGPDGNLYVSGVINDNIQRFNGVTGEFIDVFASGGGLDEPGGIVFGSDGNLYVGSHDTNNVLRFNGSTGEFIDIFAAGDGLDGPTFLIFSNQFPVLPADNLIWPLESPNITQDYACFECYIKNSKFHTGIDAISANPTIKAIADGEIVNLYLTEDKKATWCDGSNDNFDKVSDNNNHGFGNSVILNHSGIYSQYNHLDCINKDILDKFLDKIPVNQGDKLGIMGNSDKKNRDSPKLGKHLHFEIKDEGVLGDSNKEKFFGYSPDIPDELGYHDPISFLHEITSIGPIALKILDKLNVRPGPEYNFSMNTLKPDTKLVAFGQVSNSPVWYQVNLAVPYKNPDPDSFSNGIEGWIAKEFTELDDATIIKVKEGVSPVKIYDETTKNIAKAWSNQYFAVDSAILITKSLKEINQCKKTCNNPYKDLKNSCNDDYLDSVSKCDGAFDDAVNDCRSLEGNNKKNCIKVAKNEKNACKSIAKNQKSSCQNDAENQLDVCKLSCESSETTPNIYCPKWYKIFIGNVRFDNKEYQKGFICGDFVEEIS